MSETDLSGLFTYNFTSQDQQIFGSIWTPRFMPVEDLKLALTTSMSQGYPKANLGKLRETLSKYVPAHDLDRLTQGFGVHEWKYRGMRHRTGGPARVSLSGNCYYVECILEWWEFGDIPQRLYMRPSVTIVQYNNNVEVLDTIGVLGREYREIKWTTLSLNT